MSYRVQDIALETAYHFAIHVSYGFDVYRRGAVAAIRCSQIGYKGEEGLRRVRAEIIRREEEATK